MKTRWYLALLGLLLATQLVRAEPLQAVSLVIFEGDIAADQDISAVAQLGAWLIIGADEGVGPEDSENVIQVLSPQGEDHYAVSETIRLFEGDDEDGKEMDIEGLAVEDDTIYVIGSHSAKRVRVKPDKKLKRNRKQFRADKIAAEKNRAWLYRLVLDDEAQLQDKERISLRKLLREHPVLKPFSAIPSKENGIDIEGIAVADGWLYLGFRGPVLRENYVPVLKLDFDDPEDHELLYVELGGYGIRAMTRVTDGFLIVAGPVGDGPGGYPVYHWDGRDVIPGHSRDKPIGQLTRLAELKAPKEGKAEGITVLQETPTDYECIVVFDGVARGMAQRLRIPKPQSDG